MGADAEEGFFARWSRRKGLALGSASAAPAEPAARPAAGLSPAPPAPTAEPARPTAPTAPVEPARVEPPPAAEPPPPTLEDAARLRPGEAVDRFVRAGVDEAVKRAALKTLFADPHFNVMDGLDIYIDDYGQPDPIPPAMLRQLQQGEALGLFREEREAEARAAAARSAAGPPPGPGALPDAGPGAPRERPDADGDADADAPTDAPAGESGLAAPGPDPLVTAQGPCEAASPPTTPPPASP